MRAQKTSSKPTRLKRTKKAPAPTSAPALASSATNAPALTPAPARTPRRASGAQGLGLVAGMVFTGVLVVALVVLALHPSPRVVSAAVNTEPEGLAEPVHVAETAPPAARLRTAAASVPAATVAATHAPLAPKQTPIVTMTNSPADSVAPPPDVVAAAVPAPAASAPAAASAETPDVTITGCLETTVAEDRFRLTDTDGADAPKARTWRSGFLKKRLAPVELVEVSNPLALRKFVGRRVVATGLLTSRELHVRSLQSAGPSCS